MDLVTKLRARIANDRFEFSRHATGQSITRKISVSEVREALLAGEAIEDYPEDRHGPSCLDFGMTAAGRPLHVQRSYPSRPTLKIITVYEPDPTLWIRFRKRRSKVVRDNEDRLVEGLVTYSFEYGGRVFIVENVPARVDQQTGEQFFSPETVEQLQAIVWSDRQPDRMAEIPVFQFEA